DDRSRLLAVLPGPAVRPGHHVPAARHLRLAGRLAAGAPRGTPRRASGNRRSRASRCRSRCRRRACLAGIVGGAGAACGRAGPRTVAPRPGGRQVIAERPVAGPARPAARPTRARAGEGAVPAPGHPAGGGGDTTHGPILYIDGVTVSFDGFKALNNLSLAVDEGELRCIIGPNGAGKTTMMDCITGKTRPDRGTVHFGATIDLTRLNEARIAEIGIGRKFQRPTVFETLTVFENMELALATAKGPFASLRARLGSEQLDRIEQTLVQVNLLEAAWRTAGILSHGQKQWLEIGMLLVQQPRLILLDEPVA